MAEKDNVQATFDEIVARTRGISHLERIVGLIYDFSDPHQAHTAGIIYMGQRATNQDIYFPSVYDALEAHPDFHIFLANFLEQQPDARVFIGIDGDDYLGSRYLFDLFVVGKTRLCSNTDLPSIDASLVMFDDEETEEGFETITDDFTVWEQMGSLVKQNLILEGMDVDTAVLTRMVLDGTTPLLRTLIATHPDVTDPLLKGLLEQTDPTEFHLLRLIQEHPKASLDTREKAKSLGDE